LIYLDFNALVYLLHDIKPKSDLVVGILSKTDEVYTSLRTIEETTYILVWVYLGRHYRVKGTYHIQELIRKFGLENVKDELATLRQS